MTVIYPSIRNDKMSELAMLSIRHQTLKDMEILEIRDPDITPGEAANRALDIAKGELVTWAYDDDVLLLSKCEILAMYADKYPDYDVFYSSHIIIDENNKLMAIWSPPIFNIGLFVSMGNFISTITTAVRREKIGDIRFRTDYPLTDEYLFFYDLYQKGLKFKQIGVPLALVREWSGSRTAKYHEEKIQEHERIRMELGEQFYQGRTYRKDYVERVCQK